MNDAEPTRRSAPAFYIAAGAVVVLDQITKAIARATLEPDQTHTLIPGLFDLKLSSNPGAAFGILPDWAPLFIIIALVAIYAVVRLGHAQRASRSFSIGLGLVLGGAIGNLIDRLTSADRSVTDFLNLHIRLSGETHAWPTFNIADAAIVVGAAIVLYHVFILEKRNTDN